MKVAHQIEVPTDHFQFMFGDKQQGPLLDTSSLWDGAGHVAQLPGHSELVGMGVVRSGGRIRLMVDVRNNEASEDCEWHPLGKFHLAVPSGEILFWSPESEDLESCPAISLPAGDYLGLASARGMEQVSDESELEGPDEYRIIIWPAQPA